MAEKGTSKAGPITLAVGLIAGGLALLLYNFGAVKTLEWLWKLWPVLLIGVGLEYFVKRALNREGAVHFHVPSILLIVLLIFAGGAVYAATNIGRNFDTIFNGIPWHQSSLSHSRSWESGPVDLKAGEQLLIENKVGRVQLIPAADNNLSVRALIRSPESGPAREAAEKINPEIGRTGSQVFIRMPDAAGIMGRSTVADLNVAVPAGVNVRVESAAGQVAAENLDINLTVDGNAGSVELKRVGGDIVLENNTGRILVNDPGGSVRAKTNIGSVEVFSTRPMAGNYDLESSTGRVVLELPKDSDLVIDAETRTGRVSFEGLPDGNFARGKTPGDSLYYTIGAGKGRAILRAGTGSIQITVK